MMSSHQPRVGWDYRERTHAKMPRPRKNNMVPKTTIAISVKLWEFLLKNKPARETMDAYLSHLIEGYFYIKENYDFLQRVYEETSGKNAEYVRRIKELESILGNKVVPARGVAAIPNQTTNQYEQEVIQ